MVTVYANLIIKKRRTFASVPDELKEDVKAKLLSLGYDENGDPINK